MVVVLALDLWLLRQLLDVRKRALRKHHEYGVQVGAATYPVVAVLQSQRKTRTSCHRVLAGAMQARVSHQGGTAPRQLKHTGLTTLAVGEGPAQSGVALAVVAAPVCTPTALAPAPLRVEAASAGAVTALAVAALALAATMATARLETLVALQLPSRP